MKTDFIRTALLGLALVPMMALALPAPAVAADNLEKAREKPAEKSLRARHPRLPVPILNYDGGTAIINFVADVDDETMADLAVSAQNAVIGGADRIRINISSQGGSVYAMQFAVNVLRNLGVPVETVAMSHIASAAVALYCAGEDRYMADGSTLYLHQQRSFAEIQDKTAAAMVRSHRLSSHWYEDLVRACTDADADRALLDYSARDVVIDKKQATELGMVTAAMKDMPKGKVWGRAINVIAPSRMMSFGRPYPAHDRPLR